MSSSVGYGYLPPSLLGKISKDEDIALMKILWLERITVTNQIAHADTSSQDISIKKESGYRNDHSYMADP